MKILPLLACGLLLGLANTHGAQDPREFTSSDGTQKVSARFIRYDPRTDRVTLQLTNGKNFVFPSDKFSSADKEFFVTEQRNRDIEKCLKVDTDTTSDREKVTRGQLIYTYKMTDLTFKVQNTSDSNFENLSLEYWVVVENSNAKKDQEPLTTHNKTVPIASISGRGEYEVKVPTIKLVMGADPGCATCPKVIAAAAAIDRDRIVGSKVIVRNAAGEEIFNDASSNRVRTMLAKAD